MLDRGLRGSGRRRRGERARPVLSDARRRAHQRRNALHTALLLLAMSGILAICAGLLWGAAGLIWVVVAILTLLVLGPGVSPTLIMRLHGAQPLHPRDFPEAYAMLEALARRAQLPALPRLYFLPSPLMNAFAVGKPENSAIAVTDGLIRHLAPREFLAVLAHETAHVRNGDLVLMGFADIIARLSSVLAWLGQFLFFGNLVGLLFGMILVPWLLIATLILAPSAIALLQLALSRAREFNADLEAAHLTRDPTSVASALAKLDRMQGRMWEEIILPGRRMPDPSLLRTHPPTQERIDRLLSLYDEMDPVWPTPLEPAPSWRSLPLLPGVPPGRPRFRRSGLWY